MDLLGKDGDSCLDFCPICLSDPVKPKKTFGQTRALDFVGESDESRAGYIFRCVLRITSRVYIGHIHMLRAALGSISSHYVYVLDTYSLLLAAPSTPATKLTA